jgi:histidyl-tRNA synthetase
MGAFFFGCCLQTKDDYHLDASIIHMVMTRERMTNLAHDRTRTLQEIEQALTNHMALYGYELADLALIEKADAFLTRAGDKLRERLFTFERSGQIMSLRPEFTVSAASRYIREGYQQPVRWQFAGPIFEYQTRSGATNHTLSIGAERIGDPSIHADAEIIALAAQGLSKLGIQDWTIVLNHVGLQKQLLANFGLDSKTIRILLSFREDLINPDYGKQYVYEKLANILPQDLHNQEPSNVLTDDQAEKMLGVLLESTRYGTTMGGRTRADIVQRLLDKRRRSMSHHQIEQALDMLETWMKLSGPIEQAFMNISKMATDTISKAIVDDWWHTIEILRYYGIPVEQITLQMDLVRDWDYYTGSVFTIRSSSGEYIAGGGRYDELAQMLGSNNPVPAVGFAYYIDQMLANLTTDRNTARYDFVSTAMPLEKSIQVISQLREHGISIAFQNTVDKPDNSIVYGIENGMRFKDRLYSEGEIGLLIEALKGTRDE